ncbi:response regulator [Ruegeria lacuscaerulensis]|uniref:response regulator n=1 Tax=Ruegeria lacuscaerulensis TaxID=55218 RepID=UPI00147DED22|nr:response regulator [Ruegeria lacuscaerulensis]
MYELEVILHVDDDNDILDLARMGFEFAGDFVVHQCRTGAEALAVIGTVKPDLLLLDVRMPDVDGMMLLSNIRGIPEFSDLPAVFMTGSIEGNRPGATTLPGVIGHIIKPFDPLTIADQLTNIWSEHHMQTV